MQAQMRLPLTPHGIPELATFAVLFLGGAACGWGLVGGWFGAGCAVIGCGAYAFVLNFFRDPERPLPGGEDIVVSPADGKVTDVLELPAMPPCGGSGDSGPCVRIGIFLSVFDVHVNRVPLKGQVCHLAHRPGAFLDARDPAGSDRNEAMDMGLTVQMPSGPRQVLVRQIAGAIARRIVCPALIGQQFQRGERYGMIKFGSRAEVFLPRDMVAEVLVQPGDMLKGGLNAIARLKECPQ